MGLQEIRKNEETSRAGTKWTEEEDKQLLKSITDNKSYEEIALEHKRTIIGIKSRVIKEILYNKYKNENRDINELIKEYNLDMDIVYRYINNYEKKQEIKKISLEDKIKILENKIDNIMSILSGWKCNI